MQDNNEATFHVGDSDLVFLGLVAGLLARYQLRRKGGSVGLPGYPQTDDHARDLVLEGWELSEDLPLDDVPEIRVAVQGESAALKRLLDMARPKHFELPEILPDDDEGEEWKR